MKNKFLYVSYGFVVLFLSVCVVFPLVCVAAAPRFSDFSSILQSSVWHKAIKNTVLECVCSSSISVLFGYIFAYAVVRGDIPCRKFFGAVPLIHLVTPPFVGGLAFILLFGRQGFITNRILGLDISLYGFWGLLVAQVLCFFPIAYLICSQSLSGINPSLEQAARSMGAGGIRIFFTITLPLSFPGILGAFLFIAVSVLSDFGNPLIVAGRFRVLAVEIYTQLTGWLNAGTSAVLGIILVVPSVILFLLQNRVLNRNLGKYSTVGSKSGLVTRKKASPVTRVCLTVFCAVISIAIVAQFAAIIAGSFQKLWGVNTAFTLNHLKSVAKFGRELRNSVGFAFVAGVISTLLACLSSFYVHRTELPLKKYMEIVSQLPAAIPGSLFGLALSLASGRVGFRNSRVMIVIAMTVAFLPFSYRIMTTRFSQIKFTLDDSARSLGATQVGVFSSILMPLSVDGAFNSFLYDFVRGVGTLSSVIFLVSFNTPLASVKIMNLAEQGDWGKSAALSLVLTIITFAILGVGKKILSRRRGSWEKL